eukprot:m.274042 g.274042  ORF g.274042 m.274042 type:complete len:79 (+) comp15685_c0_seq1:1478-1714(+)
MPSVHLNQHPRLKLLVLVIQILQLLRSRKVICRFFRFLHGGCLVYVAAAVFDGETTVSIVIVLLCRHYVHCSRYIPEL